MPRPKKIANADVVVDEPRVMENREAGSAAVTNDRLAEVLEKIIDSSPVKRLPFAKFKTRSPFNPTGNKRRKLTRVCYQNGAMLPIKVINDEEIALLNRIKPGKYLQNVVT